MSSGFEDAQDTMFSVRQKPWHNFGKVIEQAPNIEEGIRLAGLDWSVELEQMFSISGIPSTTKRMSVRVNKDGTRSELGDVGSNYEPLQNVEAFKFFDPFIENELVSLETAGSLFSGKKVFILGKIAGDPLEVAKDDIVEKYVLLSNSHDGTSAVRIGFTPIRVVCNNTLKMAHENDLSQLIRLRHTKQVQNNLIELRSIMDLVNKDFKTTETNYKYLALRDINQSDLKKYITKVFSTVKLNQMLDEYEDKQQEESQDIEQGRKRLLARVEELFELEPSKTLWGAYNSVQGYLQHSKGRSEEGRYNNLWFGDSDRLNKKALLTALEF